MFKAINDLIIQYTSYTDPEIFKNYYNNVPLPKNNTFCIIRELHSKQHTALVQKFNYQNIPDKTITVEANQLTTTHFQVDFYGKDSSIAATKLATVLECGFANDFFISNSYPYTVEDCEQPIQLTNAMDRDNYILRYVVRFSLFNNAIVDQTIEGFDEVNIDTVLIETINPSAL
jgi:hypothetical protein